MSQSHKSQSIDWVKTCLCRSWASSRAKALNVTMSQVTKYHFSAEREQVQGVTSYESVYCYCLLCWLRWLVSPIILVFPWFWCLFPPLILLTLKRKKLTFSAKIDGFRPFPSFFRTIICNAREGLHIPTPNTAGCQQHVMITPWSHPNQLVKISMHSCNVSKNFSIRSFTPFQ